MKLSNALVVVGLILFSVGCSKHNSVNSTPFDEKSFCLANPTQCVLSIPENHMASKPN